MGETNPVRAVASVEDFRRSPGQGAQIEAHRVAFIGNSLPRRCGIATFTTDLQQAVAAGRSGIATSIVAMTDHHAAYDYPPVVECEIKDGEIADYRAAADFLNSGRFDVVSLQHEFGIFGGDAGGNIVGLLDRLRVPVVTTLHTVLAEPTPVQRDVIERVIAASARVVVMADKARQLLLSIYAVANEKIEVIPHGIPNFAFVEPQASKLKLGFGQSPVILTFGLLSPNKGIEVMIDAMPTILMNRPDAVYVVLGATHPNLVRQQGESYREGLMSRVRDLGIEDHVVFLDRFVELPELLDFISSSDVYVTPYLNEAQMTSGTLAYSFGLGKAVVSTPYWHAQELLTNGNGILVPFGNVAATAAAVSGLLTDEVARTDMRRRAYAKSRPMIWTSVAERYLAVFDASLRRTPPRLAALPKAGLPPHDRQSLPEVAIEHLLSMCDDTGLLQHATESVPDRSHGYCTDDNARALLASCALNRPGEQPLPEFLTARFAAFVQHAWNAEEGRFRNFMSYDRRWLDAVGSEDSQGRAMWALGECSLKELSAPRRRWAASQFAKAIPAAESFRSPRASAFALLGINAYCEGTSREPGVARLRLVLADRLNSLLKAVETKEWAWFEESLAYDNPRLSQALMATGEATGVAAYLDAGLRSLRWLMAAQMTAGGIFRPVGSQSFGLKRQAPRPFDQQPLEAAATVSACLAAWRADGDREWKIAANRAFAWFLGRNDLSLPLADTETGSCRDGLHPDRVNQNRGGESAVSYLLALAEMRQMASFDASQVDYKGRRALSA